MGLLVSLAAAPPAQAQTCFTNRQCATGLTCQDYVWFIKTCQVERCNADSECRGDGLCINGICRLATCNNDQNCREGTCRRGVCHRTPSPGNGGASTPPHTGALCGKQTVNGQLRVYPICPSGQNCVEGHCQVLQQ